MSYNHEAKLAIENWVRNKQPQDANYGWLEKTAESDWHYSEQSWFGEFSSIIADFEARIGFGINVSTREKRNSTSRTMQDNWYFLVRKAETRSGGNTLLKAMAA